MILILNIGTETLEQKMETLPENTEHNQPEKNCYGLPYNYFKYLENIYICVFVIHVLEG